MHGRWKTEALAVVVAALLTAGLGRAFAANPVFVDAAGACGGNTPCFTTIQQGVNNADQGADVFILPGNYPESVDLSMMGSAITGGMPGDIRLEIGTSREDVTSIFAPDAVTMMPASGAAFFNSVSPFPGEVLIIGGFTVVSKNDSGVRLHTTGFVEIVGMNSSGNASDGFGIVTDSGDVMFLLARADGNKTNGIAVVSGGEIFIANSTADSNQFNGMFLNALMGKVEVQTFFTFPGFPVTSTADHNVFAGMDITSGDDVELGILPRASNPNNGAAGLASNLPTIDVSALLKQYGLDRFAGLASVLSGVNAPVTSSLRPISASDNGAAGISILTTGGVSGFAVTTDRNANVGLAANAVNSVFLEGVSADTNKAGGFRLSSATADVLLLLATALDNTGDGVRIVTATNVEVGASYISGNSSNGINVQALGTGTPNLVNGSIICSNTVAGLSVPATMPPVNAEGDWWGAANGPAPTGSGDKVIGTSDFTPFIDTVTVKGPPTAATVGLLAPFTFQFSGGNGTVFLGEFLPTATQGTVGPGDPFGVPPFTLTTDNGVLVSSGPEIFGAPVFAQMGQTVGGFITKPSGVLEVMLFASVPGQATVALTGPCGLTGSVTADVNRVPAPAMSGVGLGMLGILLAVSGFRIARRRPMRET